MNERGAESTPEGDDFPYLFFLGSHYVYKSDEKGTVH